MKDPQKIKNSFLDLIKKEYRTFEDNTIKIGET